MESLLVSRGLPRVFTGLRISHLLIAAGLALAAVLFASDPASAQATPATAEATVECYEANGRTDGRLVVELTASSDGSSFVIDIGTAGLQRSVGLGPDLDFTVRVSGRPDGPLPVVVTADDVVILDEVIAVDCDPFVGPEAAFDNSCIGRTGRIDLNVENPGPDNADYTLRVDNLSKTVNVFAGDVEKISITGRVDGDYAVVAERDGTVLLSETITSRCEPDSTIILTSCLAENGYVQLYVPGPDPDLTYKIGNVGPRKYVQTATSNRGVTSGRPDGTHAVELYSASGSLAGTATVTVDCDPGPCDKGYNEVGGDCVTPGLACSAPQIQLEELPGIEGAPISVSCIPETDCPWGSSGPLAGNPGSEGTRTGLVRCTVALP